jgi:hypothetical protein
MLLVDNHCYSAPIYVNIHDGNGIINYVSCTTESITLTAPSLEAKKMYVYFVTILHVYL